MSTLSLTVHEAAQSWLAQAEEHLLWALAVTQQKSLGAQINVLL